MSLDLCNVFVKYLPPELTDTSLHTLFSPFGDVISCKVMVDHQTGASLGYGFVRFSDPTEAQEAISSMSGRRVSNKTLLCKLSNTSPNSTVPEPSSNLYIKPLLPDTLEDDLKEMFEVFGKITACKVMVDKATGQSRQIGFVKFETQADATAAMQKMNGHRFTEDSPYLIVKYAETEHQRASRKARITNHQNWWQRGSFNGASGNSSPPSPPNYFSFHQMAAALYGVPVISSKGGYLSYVPTVPGYSYVAQMMPAMPSPPVNPLWRPPYTLIEPGNVDPAHL